MEEIQGLTDQQLQEADEEKERILAQLQDLEKRVWLLAAYIKLMKRLQWTMPPVREREKNWSEDLCYWNNFFIYMYSFCQGCWLNHLLLFQKKVEDARAQMQFLGVDKELKALKRAITASDKQATAELSATKDQLKSLHGAVRKINQERTEVHCCWIVDLNTSQKLLFLSFCAVSQFLSSYKSL